MTKSKLMGVLASRKFWASVVGVLAAVGLVVFSESQQADLVAAIVTVVSMVAYILGVAIEDAGQAQAQAAITLAQSAGLAPVVAINVPAVEMTVPESSIILDGR